MRGKILKKGKCSRCENSKRPRHKECFVEVCPHSIEEKGIGSYLIGCNEHSHEEPGAEHRNDLFLLLGPRLNGNDEAIQHTRFIKYKKNRLLTGFFLICLKKSEKSFVQ